MDDEFVPKKVEKNEEIKEEVNEQLQEEKVEEKEEDNYDKKRNVGSIISKVIWGLITLIVIAEIGLGVINTQKINDGKKPLWCIEYKTEKTNNKEETTCHLGLYVIVKTKEGQKTETSLKPFFLR